MKPFRQHEGVVAPLLRDNVDTDAIIPSREMKKVSRDGLQAGLFSGWRYLDSDSRRPDSDFVLNRPAYLNSSILATGKNFGCGSSREHAVWALADYGFRVILAPSFGSIFERNCFNNGVLPIRLGKSTVEEVLKLTEENPQARSLAIDLESQQIMLPSGRKIAFSLPANQRLLLLNGWDPIDRTLQLSTEIDSFETTDRSTRPWAYPVRVIDQTNQA